MDKDFKKWAEEHNYRLTKDEQGFYTSTHTQSAWEAWKEARRLYENGGDT